MKNLYITLVALLLSVASFAITGPANLCVSTFTPFSDATPGGTWSSSNVGVASVQLTSGVVHAVSAGTAILTYSNGIVTNTFTINVVSSLPLISYSAWEVCSGSSISLSNAVSDGTWTSANTNLATISATGVVTGVSGTGTATIHYQLGGSCLTSLSVTVYNTLSAITGPTTVCVPQTITLSNGGAWGVWSGSNSSATVFSSGNVKGLSAGSTIVTFTNSSSCGLATATYNITVVSGLTPSSGPASLCAGSTSTFSNATAGGVWTSANTSLATVDGSTGVVAALAAGTANIIYTIPGGCYWSSTLTVTPGITGIISPGTICTNSIGSSGFSGGSATGTWSSGNTTVATVSGTMIFGVSPGTANITFTNTGCGAPVYTTSVTVIPGVSTTVGPLVMCPGGTTTLSNATPGGTWSSMNTARATIDINTGLTTALAAGEVHLKYTISNGCSFSHTINIGSSTGPISGPSSVCAGNSITLTNTAPGTWTTANTTIATVSSSGVVTGVAAGVAVVTFTGSSSCGGGTATYNVTVITGVSPTIVPATMCAGTTIVLSNSTPGGIWSSGSTSAATIDPATRVVTALGAGQAAIRYSVGSCFHSATLTVLASPSAVAGASSVCTGTTSQLSSSPAGGTWTSSNPTVATINSGTGLVDGTTMGTSVVTYHLSNGCVSALTVTVGPVLTVTALATPLCDGRYVLNAVGGTTYTWAPTTGLSCVACTSPTVTITGTTTYTATATSPACTGSGAVTLNGNRIRGNISYTGTGGDTFRVWLIKYDPTDSTVLGVDSTLTCMVGTMPYYEFANPAAGNYTVKAKKLGAVPGLSGYIPTYGLSSANWFSATTINHTINTDVQPINMIYGTVPAGTGFIAGNVYFGAGKGTTGEAPAPDMLIYLRNTATNVLTYTYTNATGAYSFSNLAYGDYIIYPEEYDYYTTPSSVITLSAADPSAAGIDFKQHTDYGTITPFTTTAVNTINTGADINIYPNPVMNSLTISWAGASTGEAYVAITDVTGRTVQSSVININTQTGRKQLDITGLNNGIYMISVRSATINYNNKIEVRH